jgi:hypothetical protein
MRAIRIAIDENRLVPALVPSVALAGRFLQGSSRSSHGTGTPKPIHIEETDANFSIEWKSLPHRGCAIPVR